MVNSKLKKIFQSEFIRNSSVLISGNAAGQAIAMLVYPILTRLYSDAEFGVYAVFMSVISILSIVATGKYEEAIMLTSTKKEMLNLVGFITKYLTLFSITIGLILGLFRKPILSLFNMESLEIYWYLIPFTIFCTGFFYILTNLASKRKKFKSIASANVSLNSTSSLFKLILGYFSFTQVGLAASNLIAQTISCFSFYRLRGELITALSGKWQDERQMGIKYKDFPKYSMSRNLVNAFSSNIPFLLLTGAFGESALGLFSLALTMGFRPITLVSNSLYQILFQQSASKKNEKKEILPNLKKYWIQTAVFLLPLSIIAYWVAPPVFGFIFSSNWELSGIYFRYLIPWAAMAVMSYPMIFIPALFGKQHQALWLEIANLITRFIVIYIGIYFHDFGLAILLYSLTGCLFAIVSLYWYVCLIKNYEKELSND